MQSISTLLYIPFNILLLILFVASCTSVMKRRLKKWIWSSASFHTRSSPVIKILSKNDSPFARSQQYQLSSEQKPFLPNLIWKDGILPLSATKTGISHSHGEVPADRGSILGLTQEQILIWTGPPSTSLSQHRGTVELCWPRVHDWLLWSQNLSLIANSFILNFNKWVTHFSLMLQV